MYVIKNYFYQFSNTDAEILVGNSEIENVVLEGRIQAKCVDSDSNLEFHDVLYNVKSPAILISLYLLQRGWIISNFDKKLVELNKNGFRIIARINEMGLWIVNLEILINKTSFEIKTDNGTLVPYKNYSNYNFLTLAQ